MLFFEFLGYWLTNSLIIWFLGQIKPQQVALGNQHISPFAASFLAGFLLAAINILTAPTLEFFKVKTKKPAELIALLIAVNSVFLWLITRMALIVGVGVSAFWWVGVLGTAAALGQWTTKKLADSRS